MLDRGRRRSEQVRRHSQLPPAIDDFADLRLSSSIFRIFGAARSSSTCAMWPWRRRLQSISTVWPVALCFVRRGRRRERWKSSRAEVDAEALVHDAATPAPRFPEFAPPWSSAACGRARWTVCVELANAAAKVTPSILAPSVRDAPSQIAAKAKSRLRSEHIDIAVAPQLKETPDARSISIYFRFVSLK